VPSGIDDVSLGEWFPTFRINVVSWKCCEPFAVRHSFMLQETWLLKT